MMDAIERYLSIGLQVWMALRAGQGTAKINLHNGSHATISFQVTKDDGTS